jgi:hypothetical protein
MPDPNASQQQSGQQATGQQADPDAQQFAQALHDAAGHQLGTTPPTGAAAGLGSIFGNPLVSSIGGIILDYVERKGLPWVREQLGRSGA